MERPITEDHRTLFAEIILPIPVAGLFTYRVPTALNELAKVGQRAIVQFGRKKILTGVIARLHETPPTDFEAKYILEILDTNEVLFEQQFELYDWMASYYMCTIGEVINAAIPSGLKLSSESRVQINPAFSMEKTPNEFSDKEEMLIKRLQTDAMDYSEVSHFLGIKNLYSILKSLAAKEAIILFETVKEKYKPKTQKRIRLSDKFLQKKTLEKLFEKLSKSPKQEAILLRYLQDVPVVKHADLNEKGVSKSILAGNEFSASSLNTLIKKGILEEFEIIVPRFDLGDTPTTHPPLLSEKQEKARNEILSYFDQKKYFYFKE